MQILSLFQTQIIQISTIIQEVIKASNILAYLNTSGMNNRSLYYIYEYMLLVGILLLALNYGINQLNRRQRFIINLGLILFILFIIIPPWSTYYFNYKINFVGYRLIFYDYPIKYFMTPLEDYGNERLEIDYYIFNYQMIALFIVVAMAVFFCRKEK